MSHPRMHVVSQDFMEGLLKRLVESTNHSKVFSELLSSQLQENQDRKALLGIAEQLLALHTDEPSIQ